MLSSSSPSISHSSPLLLRTCFSGKSHSPEPLRVKFRQLRVSAAAGCASAEKTTSSSLNMTSCVSLYDVLGISMGASGQEIKAAYRRLARVSHPDVAAIDMKDSSAGEFMKIHAAYSTLSDPEKRADYDRVLFRRRRPLGSYSGVSSPAMSGFSGYTRRWETDQCW